MCGTPRRSSLMVAVLAIICSMLTEFFGYMLISRDGPQWNVITSMVSWGVICAAAVVLLYGAHYAKEVFLGANMACCGFGSWNSFDRYIIHISRATVGDQRCCRRHFDSHHFNSHVWIFYLCSPQILPDDDLVLSGKLNPYSGMCWSVSRQSKCYAIAICAYFYGLLDIAVKVYCLAYDGFKPFIVVGLSAWLPILLAATLLFLGASQELRVLILISIVLTVLGGCLWISSSLWMLADTWGADETSF